MDRLGHDCNAKTLKKETSLEELCFEVRVVGTSINIDSVI